MPYARAVFGQLGQFCIVLMVAFVMAAGVAPKARAQQFQFDFSGTAGGTPLVIQVIVTATQACDSSPANCWRANSVVSGTVNYNNTGNTAVTGLGTADILGDTINNEFFVPNTGNGVSNVFDIYTDAPFGSLNGIVFTDMTRDYIFYDRSASTSSSMIGSPGASLHTHLNLSSSPTMVTAVPGPLAGAGILSWLAVMLMGLAWRRQWIISKTRTWLAVVRQPGAQPA